MPVYNVDTFVGIAVRSVLDQTFQNLELLVVDDGSTDGTLAVLHEFPDARLRILAAPHGGPCRSMNLAVQTARGRYVAFLDGDDLWAPAKLARHVDYMERHPDADLTFSLTRTIDEDGADLGPTSRSASAPLSFRDLLTDNIIGNGSSVVVRREALLAAGAFDPDLSCCYDLDAWLRLALTRPANIHCLPEVLTFYRRRRGQLTKNWRSMQRGWRYVLRKMRTLAPAETRAVQARASSNMSRYFGYIAYENGSRLWPPLHLARAFFYCPPHFLGDCRNILLLLGWMASLALPRRLRLPLERAVRLRKRP